MSSTFTIDGIAVSVGDLVLVKNQTTASQNGIYLVRSSNWTRTIDGCLGAQLIAASIYVQSGSTNSATLWSCGNTSVPLVGTDSILFILGSVQQTLASADMNLLTTSYTILTYTVSSYLTLLISGYLNIYGLTGTASAYLQMTYTDRHSVSRTQKFFAMGTTTAGSSAISDSDYPAVCIVAKTGSTITIATVVSGTGTMAYDAGARITGM